MTRFLLALCAWLLTLCVGVTQADPAIWKVAGKHNTVYLLGTIHLLQANQSLPANVQQAYARTQQLWLEVDMQADNPITLPTLMLSKGMLPPDQNLLTQLDDPTRTQLQATAQRLQLDTALLSRFRPWLAALTLEMQQYAQQGFVTSSGVDMQLSNLAGKDHKPTHGFETLEQQLDLFATLDRNAEIDFLKQTLQELDASNDELMSLQTAWLGGDEITMTHALLEGFNEDPALFAILTTQRNQRWVEILKPVLNEQTQDTLVAVGALHLVGEHGLVALLKQAGYRVTRQ